MYLLEDYPAPDHNTIARFRAERLWGLEKELLEQFVRLLTGVKWHIPEAPQIHHLKKLLEELYARAEAKQLIWATGKGHHATVCLLNYICLYYSISNSETTFGYSLNSSGSWRGFHT